MDTFLADHLLTQRCRLLVRLPARDPESEALLFLDTFLSNDRLARTLGAPRGSEFAPVA